jgi:hypothetical protein
MKSNGNDPIYLTGALIELLGAMSAYHEDKIDMPYERTKAIAQKINDKYKLNIDIDSIFIEDEEDEYEFDRLGKDGGCGHDQNEDYYENPIDRCD